jgi:hypothetical protein
MRKIIFSLCLLGLAAFAASPAMAGLRSVSGIDAPPSPGWRSAASGKDCLCHFPPGNQDNPQTICVGGRAAMAHLRHGDTMGECPAAGRESTCDDGLDNDQDGLADCQDPDCIGRLGPDELDLRRTQQSSSLGGGDTPSFRNRRWTIAAYARRTSEAEGRVCQLPEMSCDDGFDNDGDGASDCDDTDCMSVPGCEQPGVEICDDEFDNDGDTLADCQDPECLGLEGAAGEICQQPEMSCDDGLDNDGDALVDCRDPECAGEFGPSGEQCEQPEVTCDDGFDNDADNTIDCDDADCMPTSACGATAVEVCNDGVDNDGDGFTDCGDTDCILTPACDQFSEVCNDGVDNDIDGTIDCADPDCIEDPACSAPA